MAHIYPQSVYGQQSYGPPMPGFAPQRPPAVYQQQYYQPPPAPQQPPPPMIHSDPNAFRRDFAHRLSNLTFNSRVQIQELSMMAQDHPQFSHLVCQCLDHHVRQVPPWMKLPGFYLLDAISKNVFEPYASVFSRVVFSLYMDAYSQVDTSTRNKMEEMLLTWRTAGPEHSALFGHDIQERLQAAVWGDQNFATKSQVLAELQFTLGQMERALQANPRDRTPEGHVHVLHQLRRLVERGVSQVELRQILEQLRTLAQSALPPPVVRPPAPAPPPRSVVPPFGGPPPFAPALPPQSRSYTHPQRPVSFGQILLPIVPAAPSSASPSSALPANLESLVASLVQSGVLSSTGTSTPNQVGTSTPEVHAASTTSEAEDVSCARDSSIRDYRNFILSEPLMFTTGDLSRARPRIVDLLYERQRSQCKQCGLRFADSKSGKKQLEDHLDMHFRQNSKLEQARGYSRSWYTDLEDWLHDVSVDAKGKRPVRGSGIVSDVDNAKRVEELRAQYVVIPPGAEAQVLSCPVCKESIQSEFMEDDEEWVWRNAVRKDDKVYHATCLAEAKASTNSRAARLRSEKAHSSRSATPEVHPMTGVRSTPPLSTLGKRGSKSPPPSPSRLAGLKRKVDEDAAGQPMEGTSTPPFKKIALSAEPAASS